MANCEEAKRLIKRIRKKKQSLKMQIKELNEMEKTLISILEDLIKKEQ